jgi:hypothetical protein
MWRVLVHFGCTVCPRLSPWRKCANRTGLPSVLTTNYREREFFARILTVSSTQRLLSSCLNRMVIVILHPLVTRFYRLTAGVDLVRGAAPDRAGQPTNTQDTCCPGDHHATEFACKPTALSRATRSAGKHSHRQRRGIWDYVDIRASNFSIFLSLVSLL